MSVKVHEAFSIDSFQDRLLWWDDFLGDQLQDEWREAGDAGGSAVVVDAQTGGIVRITTDNDNTDNWRIDWADIRSLLVSKRMTIEIRVKITDITNMFLQLWFAFDATHYVGFNYDTNLSANWFIRARDAALTTRDSGIVVDADWHIYRIECFPTDEVHFYIDGVETANSPITVAANIPNEYLQPRLLLATREALAKTTDIDYVVVRQEI